MVTLTPAQIVDIVARGGPLHCMSADGMAVASCGYYLVAWPTPMDWPSTPPSPPNVQSTLRRLVAEWPDLRKSVEMLTVSSFAGVLPDGALCTTCRGEVSRKCGNCCGVGEIDCVCDCGDEHTTECGTCDGEGSVDCDTCRPAERAPANIEGRIFDRRHIASICQLMPQGLARVDVLPVGKGDGVALYLECDGVRALLMDMRFQNMKLDDLPVLELSAARPK